MTEIIRAGTYVLHAEITPIEALPGHYSFELLSQVLTAKNPNERRQLVQFTCDKGELKALADLITSHTRQ